MSEIKLKPCPFCGSDKVKIRHGDYGVFAECQGCGNRSVTVELSSDYTAKTVAIIAWNRRPSRKSHWMREDCTPFAVKMVCEYAAVCNRCKKAYFLPTDNFAYCPNCGAEMCNPQNPKMSRT